MVIIASSTPIMNGTSCHTCKTSLTLQRILATLVDYQAALCLDWKLSPVIHLDNHIFPNEGGLHYDWFVLNADGKPTVIPSFQVSSRTWERACFLSPLEVSWDKFDIHDPRDMMYLFTAIEILHDMQDLWVNDSDTAGHSTMIMFERFIGALQRLCVFASNSSIVT